MTRQARQARVPRLPRLLAPALLALAACEAPPRDPSQWPIGRGELVARPTPVDPGEAAYQRTCIGCHGADGTGSAGRVAANLTDPLGPMRKPDDALVASVRAGVRGAIGVMPAHGALLSAGEQQAVIAYVRRRFGVSAAPVPAPSDASVDAAPAP